MKAKSRGAGGALLVLIGGLFLLNLPNLNNSHPYQGDESFYTVAAVEMIESGDYLVPTYFGAPRFNKPVLTYWLVAAAYKLFGISMWAGRIPILILACLAVWVTYRLALLVFSDGRKALLAAAITAASPLFYLYSRIAMTEMVLLFFSLLALYMYACAIMRPKAALGYAFAGAVCGGLGFMAKGPAGFMPLAAAAAFCAFSGKAETRRLIFKLFHPLNLLAMALISAPWYVYIITAHPQVFAFHASGEAGVLVKTLRPFRVLGNMAYYPYILLLYGFPFLPAALWTWIFKRKAPYRPGLSFLAVYSFMFFFAFALFLGMHRARYLLPLMPILGVFAAHALYSSAWRRWYRIAWFVLGAQLALYLVYPAIAGTALRDLTYEWKESHSQSGSLGLALRDPKETGWCLLYAGGRNVNPGPQGDYLIVEEAVLPSYSGWAVVSAAKQNHSLKFRDGKFVVTAERFYLIRRP